MKCLFFTLVLFATFLSATAAELPVYLTEMAEKYSNGMKVWAIEDDDMEDEDENEFFVLQFESRQDKRDNDLNYQMRVTVQLTDKKTKTVVYAQTTHNPRPVSEEWYADHTAWEFQIPFGQLEKPKMTACVIEFGFMKDTYFVPVAMDCDNADTPEEILEGGGTKVNMKCTESSHYNYSH